MSRLPNRWSVSPLGERSGGVVSGGGEARAVNAVCEMLGRAFAENPTARATLAHCTEAERLSRVVRLHRGLVRAAVAEGHVEIVRDEAQGKIAGASLFFAPGPSRGGWRAFAWMAVGALGVGARGTYRYWLYDRHVGPLHPAEPHYYLFVLGVEPAFQGRGVGSALLRTFCERADRAGVAAYLETDKASSVKLYERHGFVVKDDFEIASLGGLRTWTMLRPRGAAGGGAAVEGVRSARSGGLE